LGSGLFLQTGAETFEMSRQVAFFAGLVVEYGKRAATVGHSSSGRAALYRDIVESFLPIHDRSAKA
jgi:hypothetical protein